MNHRLFFILLFCSSLFSLGFSAQTILPTSTHSFSLESFSFSISDIQFTGETELIDLALGSNILKSSDERVPCFLETSKTEALQASIHNFNSNKDSINGYHVEVPVLFFMSRTGFLNQGTSVLDMNVLFRSRNGELLYSHDVSTLFAQSTEVIGEGLEEAFETFDNYLMRTAIPADLSPSNGFFPTYFDYKLGQADSSLISHIKRRRPGYRVKLKKPESKDDREKQLTAWGYLINDSAYVNTGYHEAIQLTDQSKFQDTIQYRLPVMHVFNDFYGHYANSDNLNPGYLFDLSAYSIVKQNQIDVAIIPARYDSLMHTFDSGLDEILSVSSESIFIYHSNFSKEDSVKVYASGKEWTLHKNEFCHIRSEAIKGKREIKVCGQDDCLVLERENLKISPDAYLVKSKKGNISHQRMAYRDFNTCKAKKIGPTVTLNP